jgi:ABC-2 type transport system permease protein
MKGFGWLVRRELWENRAIWMIPSVLGGFVVLTALFGRGGIFIEDAPGEGRMAARMLLIVLGGVFFAVMSIYSTWYLLDCLYADRKDRSILFWKSLPISDSAMVLSKLATALIVIPIVYFAFADITTLLTAFILSLRTHALVGGSLWRADPWLQIQVMWLYLIVTTAIWYLPLAGWLLTVSAWAKRAVVLWSILPPLALYWGEHWLFGTDVVGRQLGRRLLGYSQLAFHESHGALWAGTFADKDEPASGVWSLLNPGEFFSSPETWVGAAVGVALIVCAIQLRARRTEI